MISPLSSSEREKNEKKNPTYLHNQNIQGRGTANKHVFKDDLIVSYFVRLSRTLDEKR